MAAKTETALSGWQQIVMAVLWTRTSATVSDIMAAISDRAPAYSTVLSALRQLEKRGLLVQVSQAGVRPVRYRALLSSHDAREKMLQDLMHRLFSGSPALLIGHLLETEGFTLQELKSIRDVLDRQERAIIGVSASAFEQK